MKSRPEPIVTLNGSSLTVEQLAELANGPTTKVARDADAMARVADSRRHIENIVEEYKKAYAAGEPGTAKLVYGVTTGYGEFKYIPIDPGSLEQLQRNILLSHSVGVGDNTDPNDLSNYFSPTVVRATLAIRLNTLLKGVSGVQPAILDCIERMLNNGVIPLVPTKGSLGSSGDLCPLSHMFALLLGEGRFYTLAKGNDVRRVGGGRRVQVAAKLPAVLGYETMPQPSYKDGLALTNGATFSTAMLALAAKDAGTTAMTADIAAALTLEALCGRTRAFDPKVHDARGQRGQRDVAANLLTLVDGSQLVNRAKAVQDAYSLRCAPAVHGASRDAVSYAHMVAEREINAAADNPLFFPGELPCDATSDGNANDLDAYSAGNFHGQPVALAADFLAIALAEFASISERRTQMLLDQHHNRNLPGNLAARPGVNSGYMMLQYCAASLVSENKVLTHPASVDTIPTSANAEDHNSMATVAARKLGTVLANVQAVLAIELLVAAQAIDWRVGDARDPNGSAAPPSGDPDSRDPAARAEDEYARFVRCTDDANRALLAGALGIGTRSAYLAIRTVAAPMIDDRVLDGDIRAVRAIVEDGTFAKAVNLNLESQLRGPAKLTL